MTSDRFQFLPDPGELLNGFAATGTKYVLAARLEGAIKSAFPDGPPAAPDREAPVDAELGAQHIASTDSANVILVGDVDMLSDRLWVQVQSFLGQRLVTAFANNGDFVINALDNLSGSADLIGLRSRATYTRPFTTVEELRREADARFRATEQQLQAELAETERKLGDLQSSARRHELAADEPRAAGRDSAFPRRAAAHPAGAARRAARARPGHRRPRHDAAR